jgi:membrane complex biogenesis BtpA family protein
VTKRARLVGVVHLAPLPGSPRASAPCSAVARAAAEDARTLAAAGFDGVIVENFGDAPFFADRVPSVTVSAMTACVLAVREACPELALGVNVLRNDAEAALGVAVVCGASFVRVNVHTGARVTDQGVVEGRAARRGSRSGRTWT